MKKTRFKDTYFSDKLPIGKPEKISFEIFRRIPKFLYIIFSSESNFRLKILHNFHWGFQGMAILTNSEEECQTFTSVQQHDIRGQHGFVGLSYGSTSTSGRSTSKHRHTLNRFSRTVGLPSAMQCVGRKDLYLDNPQSKDEPSGTPTICLG